MDETAEYVCPSCGEVILAGVDASGGAEQEYIEDCPVCCRPNRIRVWFDGEGRAEVSAEGA
ncbi:MAG: CPXCG motif-containing cysteine-rich protein [Planctomycetota bacterium]|nr:CPXCG motif-containing cysteine-rich protein [Planctomycetota bacterium]